METSLQDSVQLVSEEQLELPWRHISGRAKFRNGEAVGKRVSGSHVTVERTSELRSTEAQNSKQL